MASVRKRKRKNSSGENKSAWVVDYTDSHGNRQRKHYFSKKAADAFRIHIEGQMQIGTYRPSADKVTVKQVCEGFLDHCRVRHQRNERMTRKMLVVYKGHINNHILNPTYGISSKKLSQVTARTVGDFRDRLRDANVTVPTARKILATFHSALEYAVAQDWVAANAAHRIRVIGPRDEGSKRIVRPSKDNMRCLLQAADEDFRLMLMFAAFTGARAGEQWGVRWRDIDLEEGQLHIRQRVDAYGEEGAPKTAAGVRTVPLSAQLVGGLKAWNLKSRFKAPDDLVFANRSGRHTGHDNLVKRRFLPLFARIEAKGTPLKPFNWHALRHFAVSCWIEAGFAPKTVQTFAGHASLQVTMDRYGHLFPREDHKKTMDQIARGLFF
jgi:integrase